MSASETEPVAEPDTEETEPDEETDEDPEADEPQAGDEPEPEAALAPSAQTEKEIEKRRGQLDREAERHAKRVTEILGEDSLGLIQCEACPTNTPGWHYPAKDFPPDSAERNLYSMLAGGEGAEHKHPDYFQTCTECNGWGMVRTGAQPQLATYEQPCPLCKTAGYIDRRAEQAAPTPALSVANGSPADPILAPVETEDMWGRPVGHENYGKFPIYLTPAERAVDLAAGHKIG